MLGGVSVADWVQAVGVIAALCFTGWQIHLSVRARQYEIYAQGAAGFIDDARLMVEDATLHGLYEYSPKDIELQYPELSDVQKRRVHYCDLLIARCEMVWWAAQGRSIGKEEWDYWVVWVDQLALSSEFRWTVRWVTENYTREFIIFLHENVKRTLASTDWPTVHELPRLGEIP